MLRAAAVEMPVRQSPRDLVCRAASVLCGERNRTMAAAQCGSPLMGVCLLMSYRFVVLAAAI